MIRDLILAIVVGMCVANLVSDTLRQREVNKLANYAWNCDVDTYLNRTTIIKINDDVGTYTHIADPELAGHPLR